MKNLHRKISAMLLAGMVVVGGFAASGISSYANSFSVAQEQEIRRVRFYSRAYGSVLVDSSEKVLNDLISGYSISVLYNNGRSVEVRNPSQIPQHLQRARYSGRQFVKLKHQSLYYLIQLN